MQWFDEAGFTQQHPVQRTVSVTGMRPVREKSGRNGNPQVQETSRIYAGQQN
jgi:hypothetical protein